MSKLYYVYELSLPDGSKYVGMTINPTLRLYAHKNSSNVMKNYLESNNIHKDEINMNIISIHINKEDAEIVEDTIITAYFYRYPILNRRIKHVGELPNSTKHVNGLNCMVPRISNPYQFIKLDGKYIKYTQQ
jgi:predicted GIY-YIG superfamily endonuclease